MLIELEAEDIRAHTAALQDFREVLRKRLAELPEKDSANYRFRDTTSYWIAVSVSIVTIITTRQHATGSRRAAADWSSSMKLRLHFTFPNFTSTNFTSTSHIGSTPQFI